MNKTKLLVILVVALFVLNVVLVGFLVFGGSNGGLMSSKNQGQVQPKFVIIKKLNFNDYQIKKYQILIDAHRFQIRTTEVKIKNLKNKLYALLKNDVVNDTIKNQLIDSLLVCQNKIELTHFSHFKEIKMLCNKTQLVQFKALTADLSKLFPRRQKQKHDE